MKIYKQGIGWNPEWNGKIGILIGAVVALLLLWAVFNPSANVLHTTLNNGTLSLSANESALLEVRVTNPTANTQTSVNVTAHAPGSTQLSVYPDAQTISSLGAQETRTLEFLVTPIDEANKPFLPGTYRVDVSTTIENQPYLVSVFVNVEK